MPDAGRLLLSILGVWAGAFVVLTGIGRLFRGARRVDPPDVSEDFWTGFALVTALLQVLHLWYPIRWPLLAAIAVFAAWPAVRSISEWLPLVRRHVRVAAMGLALLVWIADRSMAGGRPWDFGLYHAASVQWISEFPLVTGIANLHWRLATNSSFFLTGALLGLPALGIRAYQVAGGFLIAVMAGEGLAGMYRLSTSPAARRSDIVRSLGIPLAIVMAQSSLPTLSPDTAFFVVGFASAVRLAALLFDDLDRAGRTAAFVQVVMLSALAITIKAVAIPYATASMATASYAVSRRQSVRALLPSALFVAACTAVLVAVWGYRGVLGSGYPLFPWDGLSADVDWRVPLPSARFYMEEVTLHARGVTALDPDLPWWPWPFLTALWRDGKFVVILPVGLGILALLGAAARRADCRSREVALFLAPACLAAVAWFAVLPAPRFAGAVFWHVGAGLALLPWASLPAAARSSATKVMPYAMVLLGLLIVANKGRAEPLLVTHPVAMPQPVVREYVTRTGMSLFVPVADDRCYAARLMCTPYPDPRFALRDERNVAAGFRLAPP